MAISCDISKEESVKNAFGIIKEKHAHVDFLILNAGIVQTKLLSEYTDLSELKEVLDVDLWGTILSANIFLPLLKSGSRILMISSGFGLMGPAGYSTYAAAKAGMINFAESLRRELLCKRINVSVACPGDIDTPQFHNEFKNMPDWMKGNQDAPRGLMSASKTAELILKKCLKNKFFIIYNFELWSFLLLARLTPRWFTSLMVDKMFPMPKE